MLENKISKYEQHENLRSETKLLLQKNFNSISIFTRHIGLFYKKRELKTAVHYVPIKIEKKGRCDDWAVLPCVSSYYNSGAVFPIHIEIETKSGNAVLNPDQMQWRDKCFNKHWFWVLNRDPELCVYEVKKLLESRNLKPWVK